MHGTRSRSSGWNLIAVLIATMAVFAACSSLPKQKTGVYTIQNEAAGYAQTGNSYFAQANYTMAERFFRMALDADFSINNEPGIIASYDSLAKVYLAVGDLPAARAALAGAVSYANQVGTTVLLAHTQLVSSEIDLTTGNYSEAVTTLKSAISVLEAAHDELLANAYHDLGSAYKGLGEYPAAMKYLEEALALHTAANQVALSASDQYMIASVDSKQGNLAEAFVHAHDALRLDKQMENTPGIGSDLRALGIISERQGKTSPAYDYYYSALQVFRTTSDSAYVMDLLKRLEVLSTTMGRTADAAGYAAAIKKLQDAAK